MKDVDPGHEYLLDSYDGGKPVRLVFVKREGEGYPFNVGHHPGTNCQEVLRALIARMKYLQRQIPCNENMIVIDRLRDALWQFEIRAAQRHERTLPPFQVDIESLSTCAGCGHVGCEGDHKHFAATPSPTSETVEEIRFIGSLLDAGERAECVLIGSLICVSTWMSLAANHSGRRWRTMLVTFHLRARVR